MGDGRVAPAVHWRIGRAGDGRLPSLEAAEEWLAPEELDQARRIASSRRRRDWLTGRLNLKALVGDVVAARYGHPPPPAAVVVGRGDSGAPVVRLDWVVPVGTGAAPLVVAPLAISNSHSDGYAAGAAVWLDGLRDAGRGAAVGIDLERVAPRSAGLVRDFLTGEEGRYCLAAGGRDRDQRVTVVWSAKESVLKVLGRGLGADTYWLSCLPRECAARARGRGDSFDLQPSGPAWHPFSVTCDARLGAAHVRLAGWWRVSNEFAVSIAVGSWALDEKRLRSDMADFG